MFVKASAIETQRSLIWDTVRDADVWASFNFSEQPRHPSLQTAAPDSEAKNTAIRAILSMQCLSLYHRKSSSEETAYQKALNRLHTVLTKGFAVVDSNLGQAILNDALAALVLCALNGFETLVTITLRNETRIETKEIDLDLDFLTEHMDATYGQRWRAVAIEGQVKSSSRPPERALVLNVLDLTIFLWKE